MAAKRSKSNKRNKNPKIIQRKISLEEKLESVKLDEAVIQNTRTQKWHDFRKQYEDFIFREKRDGFAFGLLIGAILTFIILLSIASTL
jgi:hypothetical protein